MGREEPGNEDAALAGEVPPPPLDDDEDDRVPATHRPSSQTRSVAQSAWLRHLDGGRQASALYATHAPASTPRARPRMGVDATIPLTGTSARRPSRWNHVCF